MPFSYSKNRGIIKVLLFLIFVGAVLLFGFWYMNGSSLGPKSFARDFLYYFINFPRLLAYQSEFNQYQGQKNKILFVHHSVGVGFLRDGRLRELLQDKGFQLWDQGYRREQLAGPDGKHLGFSFNMPADSTDPDGLFALFSQKEYGLPLNGLSQFLQYDIIVLKSCYPVSYIESDAKYQKFQQYYLGIRNVIDQHPDKLFIILTQPPLNPAATDAKIASRARRLATWLKSEEFVGGRQNLAVFDLFDVLAEPDPLKADANMLREEYREWEDSHPNAKGNAVAAKMIADFVAEKADSFQQLLGSRK